MRFRPWSFELKAKHGGNTVMVNATNKIGQTQASELIFNRRRLPQQRDAEHHADGLREETMRTFVIAFAAALIALPRVADEQQIS